MDAHWFIDFEFPNANGKPYKSSGGAIVASELGEIPEGWQIGNFEEEIEIQKGISLLLKTIYLLSDSEITRK